MRARVPNHHPRTTFHTVSGETVRKVPEVPEMEPHETSQRHHSARSLPGMMARPTLGGLLEPLFGQFLDGVLGSTRSPRAPYPLLRPGPESRGIAALRVAER